MKFRGKTHWALLVCLLLAFSVVAGCAGGNDTETEGSGDADVIKLGFLGALTGSVANYGIPAQKGMEMAIEELNAKGGILGKQVEGIYLDNKGDSSEISLITDRYITRDKVTALVGDPCTGPTKVAADIAQKNQIVLFSAGATGDGVVEIGDYIFRNTLLDIFAVPPVVEWMVKTKGWNDIAVITSLNNGYSTALTPVFKDAIAEQGANIIIEESINDEETDFTAQITNIKNANPDVLVFTGYYREAALLMNEANKQGLDINLIGGDGLYGQDLIKLGGQAVEEKVIFYCGFSFSSDNASPQTAAFLEAYKNKYNEDPDMFSAQYYDAVMILAKAMEDANSTDSSVFKEELAKLQDYPGVSGNTTFRADREPIKSPICLITPKDGKLTLVDEIPLNIE